MVAIPPLELSTVTKIYESYEKRQDGKRRLHLGASEVGKECERKAWYNFRWVIRTTFEGRMLRLFDHGNLEENRLVNDLRAIGATVEPFDMKTGRQFRYTLFGGHFGGSMDGRALGLVEAPKTWHLLEFKTHNEKSFKDLEKNGVEKSKPEHFVQMQTYMGMSQEMGDVPLKRALYLAVNKNTDHIYAERVKYDGAVYLRAKVKAERIIFSPRPLPRISERPDFYQCKWCEFQNVCHAEKLGIFEKPDKNCRTCAHSTPLEDGTWKCEKWNKILNQGEQEVGCSKHLYLPHLLPWKPIDTTDDGVVYQKSNGLKIINYEGGHFHE